MSPIKGRRKKVIGTQKTQEAKIVWPRPIVYLYVKQYD